MLSKLTVQNEAFVSKPGLYKPAIRESRETDYVKQYREAAVLSSS